MLIYLKEVQIKKKYSLYLDNDLIRHSHCSAQTMSTSSLDWCQWCLPIVLKRYKSSCFENVFLVCNACEYHLQFFNLDACIWSFEKGIGATHTRDTYARQQTLILMSKRLCTHSHICPPNNYRALHPNSFFENELRIGGTNLVIRKNKEILQINKSIMSFAILLFLLHFKFDCCSDRIWMQNLILLFLQNI